MLHGRLRLSEQDKEQRSEQLTKALLSVMDYVAGADKTSNTPSTVAPFADKINLILQVLSTLDGQIEDPVTANEAISEAEVQMTYRELRCWYVLSCFLDIVQDRRVDIFCSRIILYLRIIALHRSEILSAKWTFTEQGRLIIGLCTLLDV